MMGFESHELDESGRTLTNGFPDEYRAWFAEHAPPGVMPDDHGVYWNSWHARPWHTERYLHPTAWTMSRLWRKTYAYEGSARIPFLLVPPGRLARRDGNEQDELCGLADEVVELRDVMPTLLEAAGLPIPNTVDGCSLLPLLRAPATRWRPYIHGEHCTCYSTD